MWQWLKRLYHQLGSPRYFYELTGRWLPWLAVPALVLTIAGCVWGLAFAPQDYQQGNSFRIIYIHVPSAGLAMSIYLLMAVAGAIGLVWKMKLADMVAKSCVMFGTSMCFIALFTGAVWGKPTWGTWWVWDARLTSMLFLLFLYLGVWALHNAIHNPQTAARATAVLSLVGVVNIPIIKYSVDWWNTLHQPATFKLTEKPAMPPEMYLPLICTFLGLYLLAAVVVIMQTRAEILHREFRSQWVQKLVEDH